MRVVNQFLCLLAQNLNCLFLFSFFIAVNRDHAFITVIAFEDARFLVSKLFVAIAFEKINFLDLENLHRFRLLTSFPLLHLQYLQLLPWFQKADLKEV